MSSIFASGSDVAKVWTLSNTASALSTINSKHAVADLIWLAGGYHLVHCESSTNHLSCARFSSSTGVGSSKSFTSLPGGASSLASLRSSSHFLCGGSDCIARLVSASDGSVQRAFPGQTTPIRSISASCSESCFAVTQDDGVVVHKLSGNTSTVRFSVPGCKTIQHLRFSNHSDNLVAVVCDGGKTVVWDVVANQEHASFLSHQSNSIVRDVSFSPRNPLLMVSAGDDKQLIFHDVPKRMVLRSFQCSASLYSAAILHDGFTVLAGSETGEVLVYDLRAGDALKERIAAHKQPVTRLVARTSSSGSSGGSSRRSKSGSATSASSSSSRSRPSSKPMSSLAERPVAASTKLASEASPALPVLGTSRYGSAQQTPALEESKHPTPTLTMGSKHPTPSATVGQYVQDDGVSLLATKVSSLLQTVPSGSSTIVSSIGPSPISAIGQSPMPDIESAAGTAGPSPLPTHSFGVSPIGVSQPVVTLPATTVAAAAGGVGPAARKPLAGVTSLTEGDIFSPLKSVAPAPAPGDHHRLASSPQLAQSSSILNNVRRANAVGHRPSPLSMTTSRDDSQPGAPALRSLQQAEGMETSKVVSISTQSTASVGSLTSQHFSPHASVGTASISQLLQQRTTAHQPAPITTATVAAAATSRQYLPRDAIDGSDDVPSSRSGAQSYPSVSSPQSSVHRQILGADHGSTGGGSSSSLRSITSPGSTTASSVTALSSRFSPPHHAAMPIQSISMATDSVMSPANRPVMSSSGVTSSSLPASSDVSVTPNQAVPLQTLMLQRMIDQAVDDLRLAMHQHIRNVHVNLIRQISDQTAELLSAQAQQYEVTEALLLEMQFLREEVRRMQERY